MAKIASFFGFEYQIKTFSEIHNYYSFFQKAFINKHISAYKNVSLIVVSLAIVFCVVVCDVKLRVGCSHSDDVKKKSVFVSSKLTSHTLYNMR